MLKKLLISSVAAAALTSVAVAGDFELNPNTEAAYAYGGLALQQVTDYDSGFALVVGAGLPVMTDLFNEGDKLVAEGEFTTTLSSPTYDTTVGDYEVSLFTLAGYVGYVYDITPEFYIKPRVGFLYESVTVDYTYNYTWFGTTYSGSSSADTTDFGLSFSIGGGYTLSDQLSIYADFAIIEADVTHLTGGVVYKF